MIGLQPSGLVYQMVVRCRPRSARTHGLPRAGFSRGRQGAWRPDVVFYASDQAWRRLADRHRLGGVSGVAPAPNSCRRRPTCGRQPGRGGPRGPGRGRVDDRGGGAGRGAAAVAARREKHKSEEMEARAVHTRTLAQMHARRNGSPTRPTSGRTANNRGPAVTVYCGARLAGLTERITEAARPVVAPGARSGCAGGL